MPLTDLLSEPSLSKISQKLLGTSPSSSYSQPGAPQPGYGYHPHQGGPPSFQQGYSHGPGYQQTQYGHPPNQYNNQQSQYNYPPPQPNYGYPPPQPNHYPQQNYQQSSYNPPTYPPAPSPAMSKIPDSKAQQPPAPPPPYQQQPHPQAPFHAPPQAYRSNDTTPSTLIFNADNGSTILVQGSPNSPPLYTIDHQKSLKSSLKISRCPPGHAPQPVPIGEAKFHHSTSKVELILAGTESTLKGSGTGSGSKVIQHPRLGKIKLKIDLASTSVKYDVLDGQGKKVAKLKMSPMGSRVKQIEFCAPVDEALRDVIVLAAAVMGVKGEEEKEVAMEILQGAVGA